MGVLKKYKEFKAWDILDEILELNSSKLTYKMFDRRNNKSEKPNIIQFNRKYPDKIKRTYCKCGHVMANTKVRECPKCGNDNLVIFEEINDYYSYDLAIKTEVQAGDPVLLKTTTYSLFADKTTEEFILIKKPSVIEYEIHEDFIVEKSKGSNHISLFKVEDIKAAYMYDKSKYEYITPQTALTFLRFVQGKTNFPVIINNMEKIPNLGTLILNVWNNLTELEKLKDLNELFYDILNCPKELVSYIDKIYERESYWGYSSYSTGKSVARELSCFQEYNLIKTNELKKTISNILIHYDITASDIRNLITDSLRFAKDEESEIIIANYLKNNFINYGVSIFIHFRKDIEFLELNGYEISISNLDRRNLNILKNLKEFKRRGYNPKKANFFMDMFELNPLESLKYLDNRRAPNKELLKELRNKID